MQDYFHYRVNVLDLNAERKKPIQLDPDQFAKWISNKILNRLETIKPDVICIGGIITQYKNIKK